MSYDHFFADAGISATHYIHLAGKAHDLKKTSDDQAYFEVNFGLTKKLYYKFLDDPKAKTFVFISSVKACADTVDGWLTEDTPCDPVTPMVSPNVRLKNTSSLIYLLTNRCISSDLV